MSRLSMAFAALAAMLVLASPALAHVNLRYPPTGLPLDFLDNVRTEDLCGILPNRAGEGAAWQVPQFNTSVMTTAVAGTTLDVSWDLHYAHNGGFRLELYDADLTKIHEWAPNNTWGCQVDATQQNVTIDLPAEACPGCVLRFERQALEWGATYLFRTCALIDIVAAAGNNAEAACNGCSGHGTCGAGGACTCDSSAETGFFYGTHCEYENECEADADCGSNGKCVDVGDVSGPANQCFCEAGWFGDVVTMPSGLQRRTCDTQSATFGDMDVASVEWDTFGEGFQRSLTSSADVFSGHVTPGEDTVEFAMQGKTTSWIAMGMRSVGEAVDTAAAAEDDDAAAAEDADGADAEPTTETEADGDGDAAATTDATTTAPAPAAAAEGTGRRLRSRVPRILNGIHSRKLAEAEAAATPAAEDADTAAEDADGADAEATGTDSSDACPDFDLTALVVPGALGAGEAVSAADAAADATAADAGTVAEPPAKRRLMGDLDTPRMPLIQTEAASAVRIHAVRRSLLDAAAEDTTADAAAEDTAADAEGADAEGADGDAGYTEIDFAAPATLTNAAAVGAHSGGPCDGAFTTPSNSHAMVNQDIVFGQAREIDGTQYFRVVDMFTPSRSKPQPDHVFGGTDDITDAWGAEIDGVTYIKYVRAIQTEDATSDACISDDQTFHVVYAMGQLPTNFTHIPGSALETIGVENVVNPEFYKADELKFHGGGIGSGFEGRGTLGSNNQINLFEDETAAQSAAGGACTPSTLAPEFDCQLVRLGGSSIIHYKTFVEGDAGAVLAAETPSETGWVGLGFHQPGNPVMPGSTAVIATDTAENGIGVFDMNDRAVSSIVEATGATVVAAGAGRRRSLLQTATNVPFSIQDASVERSGGRTIMRFTRPYDADFTGAEPLNALTAFSSGGNTLGAAHDSREAFAFSLSADGGVTTISDPNVPNRRIHAILMITGWGVMIPLGVATANTCRTFGPIWYHMHRIIQTVGLLLATAGFILALVEFDSLDLTNATQRNHRALGITVMVFGWVQPLNALVRPHAPKEGEDKPLLRLGWEILHKGLGYLTIVLAIVTIFLGLQVGEVFPPFADHHDSWKNTYIGLLIMVGVIWVTGLVGHFLRKRQLAKKPKGSEHSSDVKSHLARDKVDMNMS